MLDHRRWALVFWVIAALATSCAAGGGTAGEKDSSSLTVFAAASLTEVFKSLEAAFESAHPGVRVTYSFASSSTLAAQINQGAPADVFASADAASIDKVRAAGNTAAPPSVFATNTLAIIVAKGNPKSVRGIADLARADLVYVAAAPGVPAGAYAQQALDKAGVVARPRSLEADVKAIVAKVTLGEADAGIVYATDVRAAGDRAQAVAIPDEWNVTATYPVAVLRSAKYQSAATSFVTYLSTPQAQVILASHGFGKP